MTRTEKLILENQIVIMDALGHLIARDFERFMPDTATRIAFRLAEQSGRTKGHVHYEEIT